jgi:hypothetical protein
MRAHNSSLTSGLDMGRNLYRRWIYHGYYPCNTSTISLIISVGSKLVPFILDLVTAQDIDEAMVAGTRRQTRRNKIVRLCTQAHAQGGVLSLADVALMLHVSLTPISQEILQYERAGGGTVPRRGTVHDMGRSVTHKAIICY